MYKMSAAEKREEKARAIEYLREEVKPSTQIFTGLHVGSGQTDHVRLYVAPRRGSIRDITYLVARATGDRMTDKGIPFGGGGYSKELDAYIGLRNVLGQTPDQAKWTRGLF